MTTSVRLYDGTTTLWLRTVTPVGTDPIIARSYDLTSAAPRVNTQPYAGRSGVNDLTEFHDGATFQTNLVIRDLGGLTRHQWVDQLRAMLQPRNRPYLYLQRDGWLTERRALVRGASLTNPVDRVSKARLEVSLQVEIPSGVLESATMSSDTIRPASAAAGRTYPQVFPFAYTAGDSGSVKIITTGAGEYGVAPTPAVMRYYGACTDPEVINQTLGETFALTGVTLSAGQYMEIDMGNRTVLLNGDPALSYYSAIDFAVSTWWELQPGANLLTASAATTDASCELDVFWFNRYVV